MTIEVRPQRTPVRSIVIRSIGYAPATDTLEVEFVSGAVYEYAGVPADLHAQLLGAASKGAFFNQFIKRSFRARRCA